MDVSVREALDPFFENLVEILLLLWGTLAFPVATSFREAVDPLFADPFFADFVEALLLLRGTFALSVATSFREAADSFFVDLVEVLLLL